MAMVPHHYEINVALNGQHFFATAERSVQNMSQLKTLFSTFKEKFPESEGYQISATEVTCYGTEVKL